jgi:hypothetical protein
MRKSLALPLLTVFLAASLFPIISMAQETPLPPCCPRSPGVTPDEVSWSPQSFLGHFVVSREMLQLQGITRSQFIDRLSESLFPGKQVDLVISSKRHIDQISPNRTGRGSQIDGALLNEEGLVQIEEVFFYRIPRYRLNSEQVEKLEEFSLTDGEINIKITFIIG